jgi:hypothetical protein
MPFQNWRIPAVSECHNHECDVFDICMKIVVLPPWHDSPISNSVALCALAPLRHDSVASNPLNEPLGDMCLIMSSAESFAMIRKS